MKKPEAFRQLWGRMLRSSSAQPTDALLQQALRVALTLQDVAYVAWPKLFEAGFGCRATYFKRHRLEMACNSPEARSVLELMYSQQVEVPEELLDQLGVDQLLEVKRVSGLNLYKYLYIYLLGLELV